MADFHLIRREVRARNPLLTLAMGRVLVLLLVLLLSLGAAVSVAEEAGPRGAELLKPFKQQMMGALKAGLAEGPAAAVQACSVQAPDIAAALSRDGVEMGRSTHRPRNPANAGPDWAADVLRDYLAGDDWTPRTVPLGPGREGYVEPIETQALCLLCHGSNLAPDVAEMIRRQYPDDEATGFAEGDLRGVFWVSYPLSGAESDRVSPGGS
jgi:hypothetical protein